MKKAGSTDGYRKKAVWISVFSVLITAVAVTVFGMVLEFDRYRLLRNAILVLLCSLTMVFTWFRDSALQQLNNENAFHPVRFFLIYLIGLVSALVFSRLPVSGWAYLTLFIVLSLFGSAFVGLMAGTTLLVCSLLLCGNAGYSVFLVYFISGLVGISLFQHLEETEHIETPLTLSVLMQAVCILANQVLMQNTYFTLGTLIIPLANIIVNSILLFLILNFYNTHILLSEHVTYQMIDDPEYELMQKIREVSPKDFFHAVHTTYLTDRICNQLQLDSYLAKCIAYYYRADKILSAENVSGNGAAAFQDLMKAYHIPAEAVTVMEQLRTQNPQELSKEATVVLLCDQVVTALQYFAEQQKDLSQETYESLVNSVIDKKMGSGALNHSKIAISEMLFLREQLLKERLYYDIMRNNRN